MISYMQDDYHKKGIRRIGSLDPGERASVEGRLRAYKGNEGVVDKIYEKRTTYNMVKSGDAIKME